jgi:hypothetical protein
MAEGFDFWRTMEGLLAGESECRQVMFDDEGIGGELAY